MKVFTISIQKLKELYAKQTVQKESQTDKGNPSGSTKTNETTIADNIVSSTEMVIIFYISTKIYKFKTDNTLVFQVLLKHFLSIILLFKFRYCSFRSKNDNSFKVHEIN